MKYFVTGATGFVGNHLARALKKKGHDVVAIVRTPSKAKDLLNIGVKVVQGDVTEKESMRSAMESCDGVFHVAGWYKIGGKYKGEGDAINVLGTKNVLELMDEMKIPKGVYTSTLAINSNTKGIEAGETFQFKGVHLTQYDRTKAEAHKIAHQFINKGLPLVTVMPGLIYGVGDTSSLRENIIQFLQGKTHMLPSRTAYSWAHVDDIVTGHILAMENGKIGEDYIICGPSHTAVEGFSIISKISGKKMPMIVPPILVKISSVIAKPFDNWLPTIYSSEYLKAMAGVTYIGSADKAKKELGYIPRPLKEGIWPVITHEMELLKK